MNTEKDNLNLTIFKDESFNYLYRKTEKISTALYMITNFFAVNEPIKWEIRNKTIKLLDSVMSLSTTTLSGRDQIIREISTNLFQIISLFEISYRSGFISNMNYNILKNELENLASFISEFDQGQLNANSKLFNKTFFEEKLPKRQEETIRPLIKDNNPLKDFKRQTNVFDNKKTENFSNMSNMSDMSNITSKMSHNKSEKDNQRKDKIINIIKQKGNVSVKDISDQITGVSEKTLQRELLKMVDEGVLKKEGERRWSRYSINNY